MTEVSDRETATRNVPSKVTLITGGGRGIGAACALLAAQRGHAVAVSYRDNKGAAGGVVRAIEQSGGRAIAIRADVASESDVLEMFAAVDGELGRVTALVNNAGIVAPARRVDQYDLDRLQRMFATNVIGSFLCAREAVRRMSTRYGGAGGAIVNVSSAASRLGSPNEYVDYAASKGAVDTMTIGLAKEVAAEGIRVNAIRPGLIYTDIHASGGESGRVERLKDMVPMRRGGTPEEVANAVLWLMSDEASYLTGALVDVSGGR
jgi:NAD(P)-dependent dehydrogenase (short-subunit alcohol dehydrogenase family)